MAGPHCGRETLLASAKPGGAARVKWMLVGIGALLLLGGIGCMMVAGQETPRTDGPAGAAIIRPPKGVASAVAPAAVELPAETVAFPQFVVPGQQDALDRLRDMFLLHQSPKAQGTFHLPYVMPAVLWPATGTNASAVAMRQHYRAALLTRKIDDEGYVTSNQHRGHAHDDERVVEDAVGVIVQAGVNRRLGRRAHRIDHEGVVEKHSRTRERIHVGRLQTGRAGRAVFC